MEKQKIEEAQVISEEKPLTEEQKEMLELMAEMNSPDKADALIRNEKRFNYFKSKFGNFKTKKCRRKSCGRMHLKIKDFDFCSKECELLYYKK